MTPTTAVQESHGSVIVPRERRWRKRAALALVNLAHRFKSDILLCAGSMCIDAKSSLMALMMLDALRGQGLELTARGADSELAVQSLTKLFHVA